MQDIINGVERLLECFQEQVNVGSDVLTVQDMIKNTNEFILTHQNNPELYKTTEEWRKGYYAGAYSIINLLLNKNIKQI